MPTINSVDPKALFLQNPATGAANNDAAPTDDDELTAARALVALGGGSAAEGSSYVPGSAAPQLNANLGTAQGPTLPNATAAAAAPAVSQEAVASVSNVGYPVVTGLMAYSIIAEALQKMQSLSAKTRIAAQNAANTNAIAGAIASIKEAVAKRSEALSKLGFSLGGVAVSGLTGFGGARPGGQVGATMQAVTQSTGQAVTAIGDAYSSNMGPGYTASQAQIARTQADLQKTFFQQQTDGFSSSDKQNLEAINQALSLLQEYNRRQSDTLKAIAS